MMQQVMLMVVLLVSGAQEGLGNWAPGPQVQPAGAWIPSGAYPRLGRAPASPALKPGLPPRQPAPGLVSTPILPQIPSGAIPVARVPAPQPQPRVDVKVPIPPYSQPNVIAVPPQPPNVIAVPPQPYNVITVPAQPPMYGIPAPPSQQAIGNQISIPWGPNNNPYCPSYGCGVPQPRYCLTNVIQTTTVVRPGITTWTYITSTTWVAYVSTKCTPYSTYGPSLVVVPSRVVQPGGSWVSTYYTQTCVVCPPPNQPCNTPVNPCFGHNQCTSGQLCCPYPGGGQPGCVPSVPAAIPVSGRSGRDSQSKMDGVPELAAVRVSVGSWANTNIIDFIAELLLPLKLELQGYLHLTLDDHSQENTTTKACEDFDVNCAAQKLLTCLASEEQGKLEDAQEEARNKAANTNIPENGRELESSVPVSPGENEVQNGNSSVSLQQQLQALRQESDVRFLSVSLCIMRSFQSNVLELKKNAVMAAKWCVRSHSYPWKRVQKCVKEQSTDPHGLPPQQPSEDNEQDTLRIFVNEMPIIVSEDAVASLCTALEDVGSYSTQCDYLMQKRKQEGSVNTDVPVLDEAQDSDSQGETPEEITN